MKLREDVAVRVSRSPEAKLFGNYQEGVAKSLLKVLAMLEASTLKRYEGAQIDDAMGCASWVFFPLGGLGWKKLAKPTLLLHGRVYAVAADDSASDLSNTLPNEGSTIGAPAAPPRST